MRNESLTLAQGRQGSGLFLCFILLKLKAFDWQCMRLGSRRKCLRDILDFVYRVETEETRSEFAGFNLKLLTWGGGEGAEGDGLKLRIVECSTP